MAMLKSQHVPYKTLAVIFCQLMTYPEFVEKQQNSTKIVYSISSETGCLLGVGVFLRLLS